MSGGEQASTVTVVPSGRDAAAIAAALRREAPGLAATSGQALTIDWPTDFSLDTGTEDIVTEVLREHAPTSLAYTFGGADREPVQPSAVTLKPESGGGVVCDLDTDTGKPADLARALKRRLPLAATQLAGKSVKVNVKGSGAVSRTVRRALRAELEAAGVSGARLIDHGDEDVLLPLLLSIEPTEGALRITLTPAGRNDEQIERAAGRELDNAEIPDGAVIHLCGGDHAAVTAALIGHGVGRILLEGAGDRQVHPPLFEPAARDGDSLTLSALQGEHAAADPLPQLERELPAELKAQGDLKSAEVTLVWPNGSAEEGPAKRAIEMLIGTEPAAVYFDEGDGMPMQVYPDLPEPVEEELPEPVEELPEPVVEEASPTPPAAPQEPQVVVLGRRDEGEAGMLLLGVDWTQTDEGRATVEAALQAMSGDFAGRRVLVVFRAGGQDRAAPDQRPLAQLVQKVVTQNAAALLFYRIPARPAAPHFEVVQSSLEQLAVGSLVRDPRRG